MLKPIAKQIECFAPRERTPARFRPKIGRNFSSQFEICLTRWSETGSMHRVSLDRAREYSRSEYERNKKIMPESEARRQYDKDLANIAQETRDKGVGR